MSRYRLHYWLDKPANPHAFPADYTPTAGVVYENIGEALLDLPALLDAGYWLSSLWTHDNMLEIPYAVFATDGFTPTRFWGSPRCELEAYNNLWLSLMGSRGLLRKGCDTPLNRFC